MGGWGVGKFQYIWDITSLYVELFDLWGNIPFRVFSDRGTKEKDWLFIN